MSGSWTCTTEAAIRSSSADFVAGEKACGALAQNVDQVGAMLTADAGNGWEGVEGDSAVGLQSLAKMVASQVSELSEGAIEFEQQHGRAASLLESLESESDALLLDAEEVFVRYTDAEAGVADSWAAATAHIQTRNYYDSDSAEWFYADRAFWGAVESARAYEALQAAAAEELDEMQTSFDALREDEDDVHQQFADELLGVDLTVEPVAVDASGVSAKPVGLVLEALDAAAVALPTRSHSYFARVRRSAVSTARNYLGAATGSDVAARDARVRTVQLTQQLRQVGSEDFADGFAYAVESIDAGRTRRQAELLLRGIGAMPQEEAALYLERLSMVDQFTAMALYEVPAHPAVVDTLMRLGEGGVMLGVSPNQSQLLLDALGDEARNVGFDALISRKAYSDILSQANGYGRLRDGLDGRFGLVSPHTSIELGAALRTHFVENPELLTDLVVSIDGAPLQRVLDVIERSDPTESEWGDVVGAYISDYPFDTLLVDDSRADPWAVWEDFGSSVGSLRAQIDNVGGGSYDPAGAIRFALKHGLGAIPVAGSLASKTFQGLDALVGGYTANDVYDRIADETQADMARHVLAMAALAQSDPDVAIELSLVLDGIEPGQELAAINEFRTEQSALSIQVSAIASRIEHGESAALSEAD